MLEYWTTVLTTKTFYSHIKLSITLPPSTSPSFRSTPPAPSALQVLASAPWVLELSAARLPDSGTPCHYTSDSLIAFTKSTVSIVPYIAPMPCKVSLGAMKGAPQIKCIIIIINRHAMTLNSNDQATKHR